MQLNKSFFPLTLFQYTLQEEVKQDNKKPNFQPHKTTKQTFECKSKHPLWLNAKIFNIKHMQLKTLLEHVTNI